MPAQTWPLQRNRITEYVERLKEMGRTDVTTICAHCGDRTRGHVLDGSKWYAEHLETQHPEKIPEPPSPRRKK